MKNKYVDAYIVGDKLQSISYEHNAFTYLFEHDFPSIRTEKRKATNLCRRFHHPELVQFVNATTPFEKYGLPPVTPFLVEEGKEEGKEEENEEEEDEEEEEEEEEDGVSPIVLFEGLEFSYEDKDKRMNTEIESIMKYFEQEVEERGRKPSDFLIVTPFTSHNPLVDALQLSINMYWKGRIGSNTEEYVRYAIVLCVIGIVYASVIAIMQKDLKKLFAYSSVAHVGLIAAGIFALNMQGLQGSVVQMLAHGVNVVGLFFCADIIFNRTQSLNVEGLGGIRNVAPKFNTLFMIVVLGSVALPLTNGFIGEFLLLFGVYEYNTWLSVFAGLTIILGAVYMLRMFQNVMLGNTNETTSVFEDLKWNEMLVLGIIAIVIIVMGVYPKPVFEMAEPALQQILNNALIK